MKSPKIKSSKNSVKREILSNTQSHNEHHIEDQTTISQNETMISNDTSLKYQLLFLPLDDINFPRSFMAFCPFTKIYAEGFTILELSQKWEEKARKDYPNHSFLVPKYLMDYHRKLFIGEKGDVLVYNIDIEVGNKSDDSSPSLTSSSSSITKTITKWILFCPYTHEIIEYNRSDSSKIDGNVLQSMLPLACMDWSVSCTPILLSEGNSRTKNNSLTPNVIN